MCMLTTASTGHHIFGHPSLTTVLSEQSIGFSVAKWNQYCELSGWNSRCLDGRNSKAFWVCGIEYTKVMHNSLYNMFWLATGRNNLNSAGQMKSMARLSRFVL